MQLGLQLFAFLVALHAPQGFAKWVRDENCLSGGWLGYLRGWRGCHCNPDDLHVPGFVNFNQNQICKDGSFCMFHVIVVMTKVEDFVEGHCLGFKIQLQRRDLIFHSTHSRNFRQEFESGRLSSQQKLSGWSKLVI